jgi:hypothetical protein
VSEDTFSIRLAAGSSWATQPTMNQERSITRH